MRRVVLLEHGARPNRQTVVLECPIAEPPVWLAAIGCPPARRRHVRERAATGADIEQASRLAVPDVFNCIEAFVECDFAAARLRDKLFVGSAGVALEDGIGPQARAHVLQAAARASDKLVIQTLIARTAERARKVNLSRG